MGKQTHENPYRKGLYHEIFTYWQKKQVVTRQELIDFTMTLGKSIAEANAAVTVILSPRRASKRGDIRGNISANGHLYFAEKLGRQVHTGIRDPQKFRLRWREIALEPRTRQTTEVKQEKSEVVTKAPAITKSQVTEKAVAQVE